MSILKKRGFSYSEMNLTPKGISELKTKESKFVSILNVNSHLKNQFFQAFYLNIFWSVPSYFIWSVFSLLKKLLGLCFITKNKKISVIYLMIIMMIHILNFLKNFLFHCLVKKLLKKK